MLRKTYRTRYRIASMAFLLVAFVFVGSATAQQVDIKVQAKELVSKGLQSQIAGRYDEAITFYKAAYDLLPHPELLFNLGQAHRLRGDRVVALDYYRKYVALQPNGRASKEAKEWTAQIEKGMREEAAEAERKLEEERLREAARKAEEEQGRKDAELAEEEERRAQAAAIDLPHYSAVPAQASPRSSEGTVSSDQGMGWMKTVGAVSGMGSLFCFTAAAVFWSKTDDDNSMASKTTGFAIAGSVLAAGGAVLWFSDSTSTKPSAPTTRVWAPTFDGKTAGLVMSTAF